jgi:hypothetical protein
MNRTYCLGQLDLDRLRRIQQKIGAATQSETLRRVIEKSYTEAVKNDAKTDT